LLGVGRIINGVSGNTQIAVLSLKTVKMQGQVVAAGIDLEKTRGFIRKPSCSVLRMPPQGLTWESLEALSDQ
jgi:hypothetical protein